MLALFGGELGGNGSPEPQNYLVLQPKKPRPERLGDLPKVTQPAIDHRARLELRPLDSLCSAFAVVPACFPGFLSGQWSQPFWPPKSWSSAGSTVAYPRRWEPQTSYAGFLGAACLIIILPSWDHISCLFERRFDGRGMEVIQWGGPRQLSFSFNWDTELTAWGPASPTPLGL